MANTDAEIRKRAHIAFNRDAGGICAFTHLERRPRSANGQTDRSTPSADKHVAIAPSDTSNEDGGALLKHARVENCNKLPTCLKQKLGKLLCILH